MTAKLPFPLRTLIIALVAAMGVSSAWSMSASPTGFTEEQPDGSEVWEAEGSSTWANGANLGRDLGAKLRRQCDPAVLIGTNAGTTG